MKNSKIIYFLVFVSGMAALGWEALWQVRSTLALGVSAQGTALTLAVTMGGMCLGALLMGQVLRGRTVQRPVRIYAALEAAIGVSGLFLGAAFGLVENLDAQVYAAAPGMAPWVHIIGVAAAFGLPALCLGATLPVLGLIARGGGVSIATLYALNTLGAAAGVLITAFLLIPALGLTHAGWALAAANITAAVFAWNLKTGAAETREEKKESKSEFSFYTAMGIAAVTGLATFMLEVAWFRSLSAAFMSTTDAFAIMLACVLLALGAGAWAAPVLKKRKATLGVLLGWSGVLILLMTPVIERFDLFMYVSAQYPLIIFMQWFFISLYVLGAPMVLLGVALPWLLDDESAPRRWGLIYGVNALFAILGAVAAAWIFLPSVGFARTAWLAGVLAAGAGIMIAPQAKRAGLETYILIALLIAAAFQSGVGVTRVQGTKYLNPKFAPEKILEAHEGPAATASAVEYASGRRVLFIDGFSTAEMAGAGDEKFPEHYMAWMGHLPMLLHPDPKNALVICFGTGQTANAVRKENPEILDIVDLNPDVLKLAHNFPKNEDVLSDPRVKTTIMDGRAYVRRTLKKHDVITLEPMPPNFAGVNALYSREFYEQARARLSERGVIAQWLPFHLLRPEDSASIARTFQEIFPNAILWIDPPSTTGILLGSADGDVNFGENWPGLARNSAPRDLPEEEIRKAVYLKGENLRRYGAFGTVITDDNQLLAYGRAAHALREGRNRKQDNQDLLEKASGAVGGN